MTIPNSEQRAESTEQGQPSGEHYQALTDAVRDLVNVMRQGDLDRLELEQGDLRIVLSAREKTTQTMTSAPPSAGNASQQSVGQSDNGLDMGGEGHLVVSPMVGTYYAAPAPGERPFVQVGDTVEVGQTVAIIEAMKIMNEISADRAGIVDEILVSNAESVEYGHPLVRLRVDG